MSTEFLSLTIFVILLVLLFFMFRQKKGWVWLLRKRMQISDKILSEDLLKCMAECQMDGEELSVKTATQTMEISETEVSRIFGQLQKQNFLQADGKNYKLTNAGLSYGLRMIRAHRLYELFMAEHSGYREEEWHEKAHIAEHSLTDDEINELDKRLNFPIHDPHGDPIPNSDGVMKSYANRLTLNDLKEGDSGMIIHLEDEPPVVYKQLTRDGLFPGQYVTVQSIEGDTIQFNTRRKAHTATPVLAANIQLIPRDPQDIPVISGKSLADCPQGRMARIQELSPKIIGSQRRRLMDLGFLPGTVVEKEIVSAAGDPMGFRIRDTLIALRKSQADNILAEILDEEPQKGAI